jgi:hypothetical protein
MTFSVTKTTTALNVRMVHTTEKAVVIFELLPGFFLEG